MENNLQANLETKRDIKAALIALLKQEKYENIRMTDIIRKSGVSRMGVYNNCKSKEEIMLDMYSKPINELFSTLNVSIDSNLEWLFKTAYKHKSFIHTLIDAGLAHIILDMMNARFENADNLFYNSIWNGLIYNTVIEWVKRGTDESAEDAVAGMKEALRLCADVIVKEKNSPTQNTNPK